MFWPLNGYEINTIERLDWLQWPIFRSMGQQKFRTDRWSQIDGGSSASQTRGLHFQTQKNRLQNESGTGFKLLSCGKPTALKPLR